MTQSYVSPICIPSKRRPNGQSFKLFDNALVFVEPQDEPYYRKALPNHTLVVLPQNDGGIAFVRNYILSYCRERNFDGAWMLDDDISYLYENIEGKTVKLIGDQIPVAMAVMEGIIRSVSEVGQAGLQYSQFGHGTKPVYNLNKRCDVFVYHNLEVSKNISYRAEFTLKEDRDFTMQVLASGLKTMRLEKYSFHCARNGENAGGLKPLYDLKTPEIEACHRMVRHWGEDICQIYVRQTEKRERTDIRINWKRLSQLKKIESPDLPLELSSTLVNSPESCIVPEINTQVLEDVSSVTEPTPAVQTNNNPIKSIYREFWTQLLTEYSKLGGPGGRTPPPQHYLLMKTAIKGVFLAFNIHKDAGVVQIEIKPNTKDANKEQAKRFWDEAVAYRDSIIAALGESTEFSVKETSLIIRRAVEKPGCLENRELWPVLITQMICNMENFRKFFVRFMGNFLNKNLSSSSAAVLPSVNQSENQAVNLQ